MIIITMGIAGQDKSFWSIPISLAAAACYLFVAMRFGVLACQFMFVTFRVFSSFPLTLSSTWYAIYCYAAIGMLTIVVLYAFRTSLGSQPLFGRASLED
jgi:hypothetical protein